MRAAAFAGFARIGFVNLLAFRLRYYTGIITYFINVTVYYFIWRAIYQSQDTLGGLAFGDMVTYVAVGWVIRALYFNNIDTDLALDIMEGKITMAMLKPLDLQWSLIARAMGEAGFRSLLLAVPSSLALGAIFPIQPPASAAHFAVFAASLVGSILLVSSINFFVGSCAVRLHSILGLLRAKFWMQDLLAGVLVPVSLFPATLREISGWLPFEHIGFTPLMIYLGKLGWPAIGRALLLEAAWVVLLVLFGGWFWRRMSRSIAIHGG
jgi:ABC-2 type transport system permease protein